MIRSTARAWPSRSGWAPSSPRFPAGTRLPLRCRGRSRPRCVSCSGGCDMAAEETGVVIVGGGPAGLMLAAELILGGVYPVMLERLPDVSEVPKGNGLVGQI